MAEKQNSEEKRIKIYCQWRGYTIRDFIRRVHIRYTDKDKENQSEDEMVKQLFDENKKAIFIQMSECDKEDFAFWKAKNKYPEPADRENVEDFENAIKDNMPESENDLDKEMRLPYPCTMTIEAHCITQELMISQTNFQYQSDDVWAFADEHIQSVLEESEAGANGYTKSEPGITVFLWSKSLAQPSAGLGQMVNHKTLGWFDLSNYVVSMNSNVTANGGNFSMRLPFIYGIVNDDYQWETTDEKNEGKVRTSMATVIESQRYYASPQFRENPIERGSVRDSFYMKTDYTKADERNSFFHKLMQSNDLLFISFSEKMDSESAYEKADISGEQYSLEEAGWQGYDSHWISKVASVNSFDMIVLIDNININKSADGTTASIEVSGRDLSKLLIDDGTFWFSLSTTSDPSRIFYNEQGYGKQGDVKDVDYMDGKYQAINRVRCTGNELDIFRNLTNQSIDFVIKGALSRLANIEIVPSTTFEYWDNRTYWLDVHPDEELEKGKNERTSTEEQGSQKEQEQKDEDLDKVYA